MTDTKQQQVSDWAFQQTVKLEGLALTMYNDGFNVPTIGVGYAAIVKGSQGWAVNDTLKQDFNAIGASLSSAQVTTLESIAKAKNNGQEAQAKALIGGLNVKIEKEQIRPLFNLSFGRHYVETQRIIGKATFDKLDVPKQGTLTQATFQSPAQVKKQKVDIVRGIETKTPSLVVGALERIGVALKDIDRYHGLARMYVDPNMEHSTLVRSGDALSRIAQRHGTTVQALMNVNPHITNPNKIRAGDVLVLPAGAKSTNGNFAYDALNAYENLGANHTLEDKNYIGPSHEFSPEDSMIAQQLQDQLAQNTAVREARARDLLAVPSIVISNIPANAKLSAGSTNQPINALSQSQYAALQDRLASTLGNRQVAQSVWQGTTPERSATADFHSRASEALDYLDSVLNGRSSPLGQSQPAQMSYPTTPHLAGLFMDKATVDRVMTSKAYTTKTNPLNSFATQAAKSFYGAAYADNKLDTATRQTVAEEPSRASAWAAVQKETERIQAEHNRQAQATQNARTQSEQAQAARTAKQTALSELAPAQTIETHKLDTLGENAISKAMGEQDAGLLTTKAEATISKDLLGAAWGVKSLTTAALAARARQANATTDAKTNPAGGEGANGSNPSRADGNNEYGFSADDPSTPGKDETGYASFGGWMSAVGDAVSTGWYGDPTQNPNKATSSSSSSASTRVICTELVRQGLMDAKLQRLDIAFTLRHLSPATVRGYHAWAVPYVKLMKRSQLATHLIEPFARWRAEEIAYRMGARERANWKGKGVRWVGEPICWVLGVALEQLGAKTKGPDFTPNLRVSSCAEDRGSVRPD